MKIKISERATHARNELLLLQNVSARVWQNFVANQLIHGPSSLDAANRLSDTNNEYTLLTLNFKVFNNREKMDNCPRALTKTLQLHCQPARDNHLCLHR